MEVLRLQLLLPLLAGVQPAPSATGLEQLDDLGGSGGAAFGGSAGGSQGAAFGGGAGALGASSLPIESDELLAESDAAREHAAADATAKARWRNDMAILSRLATQEKEWTQVLAQDPGAEGPTGGGHGGSVPADGAIPEHPALAVPADSRRRAPPGSPPLKKRSSSRRRGKSGGGTPPPPVATASIGDALAQGIDELLTLGGEGLAGAQGGGGWSGTEEQRRAWLTSLEEEEEETWLNQMEASLAEEEGDDPAQWVTEEAWSVDPVGGQSSRLRRLKGGSSGGNGGGHGDSRRCRPDPSPTR
jgi:hypothetical protein